MGAATTLDQPYAAAKERQILVIEDEPPIRGFLADVLGDAGYQVLQAADGMEGLKQLRRDRPDLIVLDLMLPRLSGWQFLEQSRPRLEQLNIPVVIVSAIEGKSDYPSTLGAAAWLTKPLDIDRFINAVETVVGPSRTIPRLSTSQQPTRNRSILILEDEDTIRNVIAEHLAEEGFLTRTAEIVADMDDMIAEDPPAVILLDLMLPSESGFAFLRRRQTDVIMAWIPVVVLSAAPLDRLVEAKELGADAFLSKPFDIDALTALVRGFVH
ncbi:MAG TPA: response regulator [Chloroflexota bacterium]|nr:response regulator [Chloroflexota bacterium]